MCVRVLSVYSLLARFLLSPSLGEQMAVKRVRVCGFHIKTDPILPQRVFTTQTSIWLVFTAVQNQADKLWNKDFAEDVSMLVRLCFAKSHYHIWQEYKSFIWRIQMKQSNNIYAYTAYFRCESSLESQFDLITIYLSTILTQNDSRCICKV